MHIAQLSEFTTKIASPLIKYRMFSNVTVICNTTVIVSASCTYSTLEGLAYSLVFLLGLLINGAALWAFFEKRASWTDCHIYMLNLALVDFALIIFLPFRIYDAFFCLSKKFLCTFLLFTHYINMYASILTTTTISAHRYLTIRFPLQARSRRKKKEVAVALCVLIWVLLVSVCVVVREENYPDKLWTCYERCKNRRLSVKFTMVLLCLGYLVPLMVTMFCSCRIICILVKEQNKSEEKKRIVGIVKANLIVFLVCYTPYHFAFVISLFYEVPPNWMFIPLPTHMFLRVSEWIASTNCFFDSISFYFLLKKFYI